MPRNALRRHAGDAEFSILRHTRPCGPLVGYLGDCPIYESIIDPLDERYVYAGAAPRRPDGSYDIAALREAEFIVEPGLVYRRIIEKRGLAGWLRAMPQGLRRAS